MFSDSHDLASEFPEFKALIDTVKDNSTFKPLFAEYDALESEIHNIENGVNPTSDEYLEDQKKKRLLVKDRILTALQAY